MAVCSKCGNRELGSDWKCPACGADFGASSREVVGAEAVADAPPDYAPPGYAAPGHASPYAAPAYAPVVGGRDAKPLNRLATSLTVMFGILALLYVAEIIALVNRYRLVTKIENDPGTVSVADADASDRDVRTWLVAIIVAMIVIAVVFIWWTYRARCNTEAYGRNDHRFGPGWAIGGWFIPFANIWIAFRVVVDVYRNSTGANDSRRPPGYFLWWWLLMIIPRFFVSFQTGQTDNTTPDGLKRDTLWAIVSMVASMSAAVLAVLVVQKITTVQQERDRELAQAVAWA